MRPEVASADAVRVVVSMVVSPLLTTWMSALTLAVPPLMVKVALVGEVALVLVSLPSRN